MAARSEPLRRAVNDQGFAASACREQSLQSQDFQSTEGVDVRWSARLHFRIGLSFDHFHLSLLEVQPASALPCSSQHGNATFTLRLHRDSS